MKRLATTLSLIAIFLVTAGFISDDNLQILQNQLQGAAYMASEESSEFQFWPTAYYYFLGRADAFNEANQMVSSYNQ